MTRAALFFGLVLIMGIGWLAAYVMLAQQSPITVGVLHSQTGSMAIHEQGVIDATLLAIEHINAAGGIQGRLIQPVVVDGASNPAIFAREAERLIVEEQVSVVFGCWASACRKTVRPIFERHKHLLFYPVQYEGLEMSSNIVYLGATPNQQIIPTIKWLMSTKRKRLFLVGSDYVFPRAAHAIIRAYVTRWRGEIVGEVYIPFGRETGEGVQLAVQQIVAAKPDAILNTINGQANVSFFRALRDAGIASDAIPTVSFSISEPELQHIAPSLVQGDFAAWNYFQSLKTARNETFIKEFQERYGRNRVVGDPMEAAYVAVHLWSEAVAAGDSAEPEHVLSQMRGRSFSGPGGMVYVDTENLHTWKTARIGQIGQNGQFEMIWSSETPIRPDPYPSIRSQKEWDIFLKDLNQQWNGQWANPNPASEYE